MIITGKLSGKSQQGLTRKNAGITRQCSMTELAAMQALFVPETKSAKAESGLLEPFPHAATLAQAVAWTLFCSKFT